MEKIVKIQKGNQILADKIIVADRFFQRMRGLLGVTHLNVNQGIFFPQCSSVHMWGMKMPLDLVFLKKLPKDSLSFEITRLLPTVAPWTFWPLFSFGATEVLELAPGALEAFRKNHSVALNPGDVVCIS